MNAITVVRIGTTTPLAPRRNAVRAAGDRAAARRALVGLGLEFVFEQAHDATSAGCDFPPVIAMPSSSSLASGGNSPTILPS